MVRTDQQMTGESADHGHSGSRRTRQRNVDIVTYKLGNTPKKLARGPDSSELLAQKENFLNHGVLPNFSQLEKKKYNHTKGKGEVRFELFNLARRILETVRENFVNGEVFMNESYGPIIDKAQASRTIRGYLDADPILSTIKVAWSQDITSSAVMITRGPVYQPEKRTYTMVIKDDPTMPYLRTEGIMALAHHEVGTHFVRFYNDGLQPWNANRKSYKLRKLGNVTGLQSEEGLATLASLFAAKHKYLYKPALLYYVACMSSVMDFRELYDHIQGLEPDPDMRWRLVYRVKRSLDCDQVGGYGKDQCYLAGAVKILLNRKLINFNLLFTGKLCYDEVDKVKRIIRKDGCLKPPYFSDMSSYYKHLDTTFQLNSLAECFPGFLQCPNIRCPAVISSDYNPEPLEFLPLSKERRDKLNADHLEAEKSKQLHARQTEKSTDNVENKVNSEQKSLSVLGSKEGSKKDGSSYKAKANCEFKNEIYNIGEATPTSTMNQNTAMAFKELLHDPQNLTYMMSSRISKRLDEPILLSKRRARKSANLPTIPSMDSNSSSSKENTDKKFFERPKRSFRLRNEKPALSSAKIISVNDLRSKLDN